MSCVAQDNSSSSVAQHFRCRTPLPVQTEELIITLLTEELIIFLKSDYFVLLSLIISEIWSLILWIKIVVKLLHILYDLKKN